MRVEIGFQNERLDLEIPAERLVGQWQGPAGVDRREVPELVRAAVEAPQGYPPLRQLVVPGDRVTIALDPAVPEVGTVLNVLCEVLNRARGDGDGLTITLLTAGDLPEDVAQGLPPGVQRVSHDPQARNELAYLASTREGRRIYLNRWLIDADLVIPVGRIGYDPVLGYRGPWGVIFPGLSDLETLTSFRSQASDELPDTDRPSPALSESAEVSWLLGSQFQVGVTPGTSGLRRVIAGLESTIRDLGSHEVDGDWSFRVDERAELVVVGIGRPGHPTGFDDLAEGLTAATQLVQHGGKIVALSRTAGPIGPAVGRLIQAGDNHAGLAALRGHEADPDFLAARQLARATSWADVYLLSGLGSDIVEDLSMIYLDRPEEARPLVARSRSAIVVSQADLTRAAVAGESA
jgi:hypothetical protein